MISARIPYAYRMRHTEEGHEQMEQPMKSVVDGKRIQQWLDAQGYRVEYHEQAWIGLWGNIALDFSVRGEHDKYLVVHGTEQGSHPNGQHDLLEDVCNAWNRYYEGPGAYLQSSEKGLVFHTLFVVNCQGGMDDDQFDRLLNYAMAGSDGFLRFAQEQLSKIRIA